MATTAKKKARKPAKRNLTPYQRLRDAAVRGVGLTLVGSEVMEIYGLQEVRRRAIQHDNLVLPTELAELIPAPYFTQEEDQALLRTAEEALADREWDRAVDRENQAPLRTAEEEQAESDEWERSR